MLHTINGFLSGTENGYYSLLKDIFLLQSHQPGSAMFVYTAVQLYAALVLL